MTSGCSHESGATATLVKPWGLDVWPGDLFIVAAVDGACLIRAGRVWCSGGRKPASLNEDGMGPLSLSYSTHHAHSGRLDPACPTPDQP